MTEIIAYLKNLLVQNLADWIFAISIILFCVLATRFTPQKWLEIQETKHVRPRAERRDKFLKLAAIVFIIGLSSALFQLFTQDKFGRLVFDFSALVIATVGFFFTIYGIRGILDRPRNLDDVLIRATALLNRYKDQHGYTAVMLCEYPAWGALSRQQSNSNEYSEFVAALEGFLIEDEPAKKRKIILVAPYEEEMEARIGQYSEDYKEQDQKEAAVNANKKLIAALDAILPKSFKHCPVNTVPRYQMLLIGQNTSQDILLRPLEAIVWVATLSRNDSA